MSPIDSERENFASDEGQHFTSATLSVTPRIDQVSDTVAPWTRPAVADYSWLTPVTRDLELGSLDEYGQHIRFMVARLDASTMSGQHVRLDREGPVARA